MLTSTTVSIWRSVQSLWRHFCTWNGPEKCLPATCSPFVRSRLTRRNLVAYNGWSLSFHFVVVDDVEVSKSNSVQVTLAHCMWENTCICLFVYFVAHEIKYTGVLSAVPASWKIVFIRRIMNGCHEREGRRDHQKRHFTFSQRIEVASFLTAYMPAFGLVLKRLFGGHALLATFFC